MNLSVLADRNGSFDVHAAVWHALRVATAAMLLAGAASAQSGSVVGETRQVVVARGDTLRSIGSRAGVDPTTIARDNGLVLTAKLAIGRILRVDARHIVPGGLRAGTIVVNVPQRMLFLGTQPTLQAWPVAAGRGNWPTPLGPFIVLTREEHPTWDVPDSIMEEARRAGVVLPRQVPPGPLNPLGDYWVGLSVGSVGIHGTNAPTSIYQLVTHGCVRMHPDDIAALFPQVTSNMNGTLVYEPILAGRDGAAVLLEVHRDVYGRGPKNPAAYAREQIVKLAEPASIDWVAVTAALAERAGIPRVVSVPSPGAGRRESRSPDLSMNRAH